MEVYFRMGRIDLRKAGDFDVIVCPTDIYCSGSGGLDEQIHREAGPGLKAELKNKVLAPKDVYVSAGYELGTEYIAHVAVPDCREGAEKQEALFECYENTLISLGRTDLGRHPESAAITLLGTGSKGWSYEQSMDALWRAIIAYHSLYRCFGSLKVLYVYYPDDINGAVLDRYTRRASRAFFSRPRDWGARLGMGLWYALMVHFDDPKFNDIPISEFIRETQRYFYGKTGKWLCGDTYVSSAEWARNCSGVIGPAFANFALPILCSNLCKLGFSWKQDSMSFVIQVALGEYQLTLPYESLSALSDLRKKEEEMREKTSFYLLPGQPYYLTSYHYPKERDMVSFYSLDVEEANDSHYHFSPAAAAEICRECGYMPNALGAALKNYLKDMGGEALERMVGKYASEIFRY